MTTANTVRKLIASNSFPERGHPRLLVPAGARATGLEVQSVEEGKAADIYLLFEGGDPAGAKRTVNVSILLPEDTEEPSGQVLRGTFEAGLDKEVMRVYSD
jgi:hypothetical protein